MEVKNRKSKLTENRFFKRRAQSLTAIEISLLIRRYLWHWQHKMISIKLDIGACHMGVLMSLVHCDNLNGPLWNGQTK